MSEGTCPRVAVSLGNGEGEHTDAAAFAFDFAVPVDTPLVATDAGTVTHLFANTRSGEPCWTGGGPECANKANFVTPRHEDGTATHYRHLNAVMVEAGQGVPRRAAIGLSGATGVAAGPHAHVARQADCGLSQCPSMRCGSPTSATTGCR
ncbi:Peptidase family M23 [Nannocystis exedens]|uniref:Peptidase family M23 n=1 Tax=Nannocystis exedens TaxID=54 RepID=A0A1I1ZEU6_9BACT|nr:peptidoglycan DD-metalloendopeptidase family protein [Nannocystis exedens]PCC75001.1 Murein DD-endopeptidase MepM [Nannocystis exedens]SFE30266.1 Peptidase family M23 [Nannocystis exedens]